MRKPRGSSRARVLAAGLAAWLLSAWVSGLAGRGGPAAEERPYGIEKRIPWTSSKVRGSPDPPAPYRVERVFPKLAFQEPLAMTSAPGTERLFVVERYGKVFSFANDADAERSDLFIDLKHVAYGLAFHPRFAENRFAYATYVLDPDKELPLGTRVSRFTASRDDPPRCDPRSEQVIIEWPSGGHNGGDLRFGPDGFLYIATGDASAIADEYLTGQDPGTLPGSILRIDVDRADPGRAYAIPHDNPFLSTEGARPEIWAYGIRQAWKITFDRETGDLWCGNVGQDLWEMVLLIERGGNYGWSITEGNHPFRPERKQGPTPILPPVLEYDHNQGRSVTGGFVYRGSRLKDLAGAYIYGDYDTGRIWGLRYDGKDVTWNEELADTALRLVAFCEDSSGELTIVDHAGGGIYRLVPAPPAEKTEPFPRRLGETGLFASVKDLTPAPGLIPYSVIAPVWMDGAMAERYLALPGDSRIEFEAMTYPQPSPGAPHGWKFPHDTVIVQTISMEMERGNRDSRRRLETRILHHERLPGGEDFGDQYWRGYTYVWDEAQEDAALLEAPAGLDRVLTILDAEAPGGSRRQTWRFPGRAECTICHNMAAKYVLGINTLQLNREHDYDGVLDNQLRTLEHIGLFTAPLPAPPEALPRLVDYSDGAMDIDRRARSYLDANCGHCHRKWGGGNTDFYLLYLLDPHQAGAAGRRPGHGTFEIADARVLAPGDPYRSVLFYRMAKLGHGRMPYAGSSAIDARGLRLIHDWIRELPRYSGTPREAEDLSARRREVERLLAQLERLRDGESPPAPTADIIDRLLSSTGDALRLSWAIEEKALPERIAREAVKRAAADSPAHIRDLFERFLPEEERRQRLGAVIRPEEILAIDGDAARGEKLFFEAPGVQCRNCHRIRGAGIDLGPDLSEIGKKYDRGQILETLLEPSKTIDPRYTVHLAETARGEIHAGILVKKGEDEVILKDATGKLIVLPAAAVKRLVPQQKSLMPELLLRDMTAREVADLTAFLGSLK